MNVRIDVLDERMADCAAGRPPFASGVRLKPPKPRHCGLFTVEGVDR